MKPTLVCPLLLPRSRRVYPSGCREPGGGGGLSAGGQVRQASTCWARTDFSLALQAGGQALHCCGLSSSQLGQMWSSPNLAGVAQASPAAPLKAEDKPPTNIRRQGERLGPARPAGLRLRRLPQGLPED